MSLLSHGRHGATGKPSPLAQFRVVGVKRGVAPSGAFASASHSHRPRHTDCSGEFLTKFSHGRRLGGRIDYS